MRWIIRCYPRQWRDRYEDEMLALLEECKITPKTMLDLIVGAVDAHLNYSGITEGVVNMVNRVRSGVVMTFCAFIVFGVGWAMLQRINDPVPNFQTAAHAHPELNVLHGALLIVGCIGFVVFLLAGMPLFFVSIKRAMEQRKKSVLLPFGIALGCALAALLATGGIAWWRPERHVYVYLLSYLAVMAILLITGTVAVSLVVARTEFQARELRLVFVPETAILISMVIAALLSILSLIRITSYAPQLLITQDVNGPLFITGIVFMALGAIFSGLALRRSWGAKLKSVEG